MLDLLQDVLKRAQQRGATAADAFLVEDRAFSAQVRLGRVETVKHAREQHLSLRVFSGKSAASASTSDFSRTSVEHLVDEAVSLARITAPDELSGLPDAGALAREIPALDLEDPTVHDLPP
jgi:PmbA protein